MKFINEKGKKINLDDFKVLGNGKCADTYHDDTMVFKKYKEDTRSDYKISKEVFNILKDINNPHFIELYDIYMLTSLPERLLYLLNASIFTIDAYTAKLYQKENINPLYINKDYLLSNLHEIEKLFDLIAALKIKVDDIYIDNTVYTKDNIIIIDPDFYKLSMRPESEIRTWNKRNILVLFQSMIEDSDGMLYEEREDLTEWFRDTFYVDEITENSNVTDFIAKQLRHVKKPIDLVKK